MKDLDRIYEKLDLIDEKLASVDKTLVEQAGDLKHHIYRTDLAEEHIRLLETKIAPLSDFHSKFSGIMKFIGVVATSITFIIGLIKLIQELV